MGRPLNKRYFNSGAGDQIKVRAKIGANAEGDGVILRQKGSKRFIVKVGANEGLCTLSPAAGALADNTMTITLKDDANADMRVAKITAKRATLHTGASAAWTFANFADPILDMPEVLDTPTITVQPVDTLTAPGGGTVSITATADTPITYQWQVSTDTGTSWTNLANGSGGVTSGATASSLVMASTTSGHQFRCVVTSAGGSVNSNAITA